MKYLLIILLFQTPLRYDFTNDFIMTSNGENGRVSTGYSFGNGVDDVRKYGVYNGNIDLSCIRLETNNADIKINGTIIFNSQEVTIDEMIDIGRIIKLCECDEISYQ
jgi:hypothetical protein